jgi:hypothetical protein
MLKEFCKIARWGLRVIALSEYPLLIQLTTG